MELFLTTAVGRATSQRAAFDRALVAAGVADFNLVRVRAVIPPAARIVPTRRCPFAGRSDWGDRLYAVYAAGLVSRPGEQTWAGLGWVQDEHTGMGLLVEHTGGNERSVRAELLVALREAQTSRGLRLGPPHVRVTGAICTGQPTCALVICAFGAESWMTTAPADRRPPVRAS